MPSKSPLYKYVSALILFSIPCLAQVLPLGKVSDPGARVLQQQYITQLQQLAAAASSLHFPYPFYFSQALDIDEARQKLLPKGSVHFDNFNGKNVLAITGNYYISYSSDMVTGNQRARKTYQDVVLPLLKLAVAKMDRAVPIEGYAFEIAHHVRGRVLKVDTEAPENLLIMFPRNVADRLVQGKDVESQQAALLDSEVYLNGEPLSLWLTEDQAPEIVKDRYLARHDKNAKTQKTLAAEPAEPGTLVNSRLIPESELLNKIRDRHNNPHEASPLELEKLQTRYDATINTLTNTLKPQAHFVDYAPPAFISFRDGAYLQLSMNTDLEQAAGPSQYRAAALAFDSHISHMLRAVSKYFHDNPQFDGVDFSTTVRDPGQGGSRSVEFVVTFPTLLCYERYECTGQDVINRSVVLINGERVALDLQKAEAEMAAVTQ